MQINIGDGGIDMPLYVQLREQIKHVIAAGELAPESRLPSASRLADNLQINRNTALRAYRELEREGYVEFRSGVGTFVAADVSHLRHGPGDLAFLGELDGGIHSALEAGLTPERIANLALTHARSIQIRIAESARRPITVAIFECNDQSLEYYTSELRRAVDAEFRPFLISSIDNGVAPSGSAECDLVVTTFFHVAEVRRNLRRISDLRDIELFAVSVRPHLEVLQQLGELPTGTALGILYFEGPYFTQERLLQMVEHIQNANLRNLVRVEPIYVRGEVSSADLDGVDAVLVRPENLAEAQDLQALGMPVIEYRNALDGASLTLIEEVLDDIREAKTGHLADSLEDQAQWTRSRRA